MICESVAVGGQGRGSETIWSGPVESSGEW